MDFFENFINFHFFQLSRSLCSVPPWRHSKCKGSPFHREHATWPRSATLTVGFLDCVIGTRHRLWSRSIGTSYDRVAIFSIFGRPENDIRILGLFSQLYSVEFFLAFAKYVGDMLNPHISERPTVPLEYGGIVYVKL